MRLRADIWVSAFIRRCAVEGAFAVLLRRGSPEAGAIFIRIDRSAEEAALFGPAPQSQMNQEGPERLWMRMHEAEWVEPGAVEERLRKEAEFDPDLWIVEVEDREGRLLFDVAPRA